MKIKEIFIDNKGGWVGLALMLSKISALLTTMIVARILSAYDFGIVIAALNFLNFFVPLAGLGSYQGTLRYGSLAEDQDIKDKIFKYSFFYGFIGQFLVTGIMLLLALFFIKDVSVYHVLLFLSVRLFGYFFLEQYKAEARAAGNNRKFANIEIAFSIASIVLGVVLTYFHGMEGYILSLCISPLSALFFQKFRFRKLEAPINKKEFWSFNFFTAFTSQIWQWIFLVDVFIVGHYFSKEDLSFYKISSMIPFNLLFISQVIMQTEYPNFCRNQNNKKYFVDFLKNYYVWMILASIAIIIVGTFFPDLVMRLFGKNYLNPELFKILIWASISSFFFRVPYGYLLPARGFFRYNLYSAILSLILLVSISFWLMNDFGLKSMAYASVTSLTISGIFSAILFFATLSKHTNSNL